MGIQTEYSVYIVDDDPDAVALVSTVFEAEGHHVVSNPGNSTVREDIVAKKPHMVFITRKMVGTDGLELCAELRKEESLSETKIIIISDKGTNFDRIRALKAGADGFIPKPLVPETFPATARRIIEDAIDLTFWGVRGTLPVPGENTLRYGGNTSCVTMEFPKGQLFIFDGGSGIKSLSNTLLRQKRKQIDAKIFISHPHWDHINAFPFFVPLYMKGNTFELFGASHGSLTTHELISAQMDGVYFPITIHEFGANLSFTDLKEESREVDGIAIKTMLLSHPGYCLGYRVDFKGRSVCYITDNELFPESSPYHDPAYTDKLIDFVKETDVLITDCTYTDAEYASKIGWGHSPISEVVALAHKAEVKTLCLFHHDPDQTDDDIDAKLDTARKMLQDMNSKTDVLAPAEGLVLKI